MYIAKVTLDGLKLFEFKKQLDLAPQTILYGPNGCGKTTVAEGIVWVLYGLDLVGAKDYESMVNRNAYILATTVTEQFKDIFEQWCSEQVELPESPLQLMRAFKQEHNFVWEPPYIDGTVELFLDDGRSFNINRRWTPSGSRVKINDVVSTQQVLNNLLPDKDLFLSVFAPGYFNLVLEREEKRALVSRYAGKPAVGAVLDELTKDSGLTASEIQLIKADIAGTAYKTLKKNTLAAVTDLEFQIEYSKQELAKLGNSTGQEEPEEERTPSTDKQRNLQAWQQALSQRVAVVSTLHLWEDYFAKQELIQAERNAILHWLEVNSTTQETVDQAEELVAETKRLLIEGLPPRPEELPALPGAVSVSGFEFCPNCEYDLARWAIDFNTDLKTRGNEQDHLKEEHQEALKKWDALAVAIDEDPTLLAAQVTLKLAKEQLRETLMKEGSLRSLHDPHPPSAPIVKGMPIAVTKNTVQQLILEHDNLVQAAESAVKQWANAVNKDIEDARVHNERLKDKRAAKLALEQQKQELTTRLSELPTKLEKAKKIADIVTRYPQVYVSMQLQKVQQHLEKAEVLLVKRLKTGELKDTFEIQFNGLPYSRLSHSERIKADIEIAILLNSLSKNTIPMFIDNAEAIQDIPQSIWRQQHLLAFVRNESDLKVHLNYPSATTKVDHDPNTGAHSDQESSRGLQTSDSDHRETTRE